MSILHVSCQVYDEVVIRRIGCPTCKRIRFMVIAHAPWLGTDVTCLRCGEHWQDGVRADRPFKRGWRKTSIKAAKDLYRKHHPRTQATINS
jgi:hypothetical protein